MTAEEGQSASPLDESVHLGATSEKDIYESLVSHIYQCQWKVNMTKKHILPTALLTCRYFISKILFCKLSGQILDLSLESYHAVDVPKRLEFFVTFYF